MAAPQTVPELRAQLVQQKAALHEANAQLMATTAGTKEYGQVVARHQQLANDYDRTQRLLKEVLKGRQSSLL